MAGLKDTTERMRAKVKESDVPDVKPRNLAAVSLPKEGYALAVDGKIKSHYTSADAAFKAGQTLKNKFPVIQVTVFDAKAGTRTLIEANQSNS